MPHRRSRSRSTNERRRERLLIIDEHELSRKVVVQTLRLRGHKCSGVATTADAVVAVGTLKPTVVIMDWVFRDGSGVGLARRLREASDLGNDLVIVAVSTANEPAEFRTNEPVDEYLTKPCTADVIEQTFKRLLAARRRSE